MIHIGWKGDWELVMRYALIFMMMVTVYSAYSTEKKTNLRKQRMMQR